MGGGTDLPHYYNEHGGAVLSSTINRFSNVTLYPRQDNEVHVRSLDLDYSVRYRADEAPSFDGFCDLAKATIRRLGSDLGFELDIHTEAPPGSGLGGSSAVTAAVIGALGEYSGLVLDQYELAELNYTHRARGPEHRGRQAGPVRHHVRGLQPDRVLQGPGAGHAPCAYPGTC